MYCESLWKLGIRVNDKYRHIVYKKFEACLYDFCEKENIKISMYKDLDELNERLFNARDKSKYASGVYSYRLDENQNLVYNEIIPRISLEEKFDLFTLAHEIGHHLAIKNFKDNSETIADSFIQILAEEYLTGIERYIISIPLNVFSNVKMPLPKIKRKDLLKFKKEHGL